MGADETGKGQGYGVGGVRLPQLVHRHKVVLRPAVPPGKGTLDLGGALLPEQAAQLVPQMEHPVGGAVFGLLLDDGSSGSRAGLLDVHPAAGEVHAAPPQAADLLPPQAQRPRQLDDGFQPVSLHQSEQLPQLFRRVKAGLLRDHPWRLHPVGGAAQQHVLPHGQMQRAGEQIVMAAHGVGGEPLLLHQHCVIALEVLGRELLQRNVPQGGREMVADDLSIAVDGGLCAVWPDHLLHPVLQPLVQCDGTGRDPPQAVPLRRKFTQAPPGLGQGGIRPVALDPPAVFIRAVVHADIVDLPCIVIRNVGFHFFPSHCFPFLTFRRI